MAEIHVERKTKKPVWPWVVLLLVVALAAIGWWYYGSTSQPSLPESTEIQLMEEGAPLEAFQAESDTLFHLSA